MNRRTLVMGVGALALAGCGAGGSTSAPGTRSSYRLRRGNMNRVQFRTLDQINSLRAAAGLGPLVLNPQLNNAAETHSQDMSRQNRPWHFGSDGSSPPERAFRAGYTGRLLGQNISESFETETETLSAWMAQADTREVIMNPEATDLGFFGFQENSGKIWWTMLTGTQTQVPAVPQQV